MKLKKLSNDLRLNPSRPTRVITLSMLGLLSLLVSCGGGGSDSVTFDGVLLKQPTELQSASPEVRSRLKWTLRYGPDESNLNNVVENGSGSGESNGSSVDAITDVSLEAGETYFVRVEWRFTGSAPLIPLGFSSYSFTMIGEGDESIEVPPRDVNSLEGDGDLDNDLDDDGLSNLAELNSLSGNLGDLSAVNNVESPLQNGGAGGVGAVVDSVEVIDYTAELDGPAWGTKGPLAVMAIDRNNAELVEKYAGVTWKAIQNGAEVYIQVNNSNGAQTPFDNQVKISVEGGPSSDGPVVVDANGTVVPAGVDDFEAEGVSYAYRRTGPRLDYRQTLDTSASDMPSRQIAIQFFDANDPAVEIANWTGTVAFLFEQQSAPNPETEQAVASLEFRNTADGSVDPQEPGGWAECNTRFRVAGILNPTPQEASIEYIWSTMPVTTETFDTSSEIIEFSMPPRPADVSQLEVSLIVNVTPTGGDPYSTQKVVGSILYSTQDVPGCD